MSQRLVFADRDSAADALTFATRAARLPDAALRLVAQNGVLVATTAALAPHGLLDATPTVLGMRTFAVDPELRCDLTIDPAALTTEGDDTTALLLPEIAISAAWAGISPPRTGWTAGAGFPASALALVAHAGIEAVAAALPADPGDAVVQQARAAVWGVPSVQLGGLPAGAAFAALMLGFVAGEEQARVFEQPSWARISLHRGHVLVRRPARVGLTAVRSTGSPRA